MYSSLQSTANKSTHKQSLLQTIRSSKPNPESKGSASRQEKLYKNTYSYPLKLKRIQSQYIKPNGRLTSVDKTPRVQKGPSVKAGLDRQKLYAKQNASQAYQSSKKQQVTVNKKNKCKAKVLNPYYQSKSKVKAKSKQRYSNIKSQKVQRHLIGQSEKNTSSKSITDEFSFQVELSKSHGKKKTKQEAKNVGNKVKPIQLGEQETYYTKALNRKSSQKLKKVSKKRIEDTAQQFHGNSKSDQSRNTGKKQPISMAKMRSSCEQLFTQATQNKKKSKAKRKFLKESALKEYIPNRTHELTVKSNDHFELQNDPSTSTGILTREACEVWDCKKQEAILNRVDKTLKSYQLILEREVSRRSALEKENQYLRESLFARSANLTSASEVENFTCQTDV